MIAANNYYMRLEKAKLHGRWFFESLDESLKELPIDLNKILAANNWDLVFYDLYEQDGFTMFKYKNGEKKYRICLDPNNIVERKRFTLAHEIGHIILGHFEEYYDKVLTSSEMFILDKEADMVAGEILMPYRYMLRYYNWSINGLAYKFHVSKEAAQVRLNVLNKDFMFLRDLDKIKYNTMLEEICEIVKHYNIL